MNRKQKKELRERQSTRQLMGISQLTDHGVKTAKVELVFFMLKPDNLSVLSPEGVRGRVTALADLLRTTPSVRLLAMDSKESFLSNKHFYQERLEQETDPHIRALLQKDIEHLDAIQASTISAREFALAYPVDKENASEPKHIEKRLLDRGLRVRLAEQQDIKRLLAVYYQQDSVTEQFPDFDGERSVNNHGFYIGKDICGSNIIVDLNRRAEDKTNANVLILGNSGQGKSYLMKLLLTNLRESGKTVICLDPEHELPELCANLGGCFVDLMGGQYRINPLEPRLWSEDGADDSEAPAAFRQGSRLSQHISFLKDFFRAYKDFTDRHVDAIELMLERLYAKFGMNDSTDFAHLRPVDYPILSDLYAVIEDAYQHYGDEEHPLYPKALLQEILLGLHFMCRGAESKFFNGQTNITSAKFLVFGCKGLTDAAASVRNALLFNVLSYLSHRLLTEGNAVASIDELYLFLSNPTAIEYIRGFMKRVRKKDSAVMLASQNLEDFNLPGIAELTRPLFSIPTHQFLFNAGSIDSRFFRDNLQLERSEYEIVNSATKGVCLYKCGGERFHLKVEAPAHKAALFGTAGGK